MGTHLFGSPCILVVMV